MKNDTGSNPSTFTPSNTGPPHRPRLKNRGFQTDRIQMKKPFPNTPAKNKVRPDLSPYAEQIAKHTTIHAIPAGYAFRFPTPYDTQDETGIYLTNTTGTARLEDSGTHWPDIHATYDVEDTPVKHPEILTIMQENGLTYDEADCLFILPLPANLEAAPLVAMNFQTILRCITTLARAKGYAA